MHRNHQTIQWQQTICTWNMTTVLEGFGLLHQLSLDDISNLAKSTLLAAGELRKKAKTCKGIGALRMEGPIFSCMAQGTLLLALLPRNRQGALLQEILAYGGGGPVVPRSPEAIPGPVEGKQSIFERDIWELLYLSEQFGQ